MKRPRQSITPPRRKSAAPDMAIPLVNLVFLLLGFFLLAGNIERPQPVPLDLSEGEGRRGETMPQFSLTESGQLYYEGQIISMEEALTLWKTQRDGKSGEAPIIAADARAPAMALAALLNRLAEAGIASSSLVLEAR